MFRIFPRLFGLASNKFSYVEYCYEDEGKFVSWLVSFRRVHLIERFMHESLSHHCKTFIREEKVDVHIWKPIQSPFGGFSCIHFTDPIHVTRSPSFLIWISLAPPRVEAFCWLIVSK